MNYSKDNYCDSNLFKRRLESLAEYIQLDKKPDESFRDRAIRKREEKTSGSGPTHQFVNYGTISGSPVQQGTSYSTITAHYDAAEIHDPIERIKAAIPQLGLATEERSELESDIKSVEPQLTSTRPKGAVIEACMRSMKSIIERATGSLLATGLVHEIDKVINMVGH